MDTLLNVTLPKSAEGLHAADAFDELNTNTAEATSTTANSVDTHVLDTLSIIINTTLLIAYGTHLLCNYAQYFYLLTTRDITTTIE